MPGFMRERGPHAALGHLTLLGVERGRDHDRLNACFGELRKSQHALG
jgi:hypothetical protein